MFLSLQNRHLDDSGLHDYTDQLPTIRALKVCAYLNNCPSFLHNHLHKYEYYSFTGSDTAKRDIYSYRRTRCFHPRYKEEVADTSEALVTTYQNTRRHFPEYIFIFAVVSTSNVIKRKSLQKN